MKWEKKFNKHNSVYETTVTCRRVHVDAHDQNNFSHYCIINVRNDLWENFQSETEEPIQSGECVTVPPVIALVLCRVAHISYNGIRITQCR